MKADCPIENSSPLPHTIFSQFSPLLMMALSATVHTRITRDVTKLITCFKLVPEEQDIAAASQRSLNFDRADIRINQFDLSAVGAATQLSAEGDKIVVLTVGDLLLRNSKVHKDVLSRGPDSLFMVWGPQLEHSLPRDMTQTLVCAVKNIEFDLVLFDEGFGDIYAQQVNLLVGEPLQLPVINAVNSIQRNGNRIVVERMLEDEVEVIELSLPVVLYVTSNINTPHIPSIGVIPGTGKKPVTPWQASDIGWTPVSPLVEPVNLTVPPQTECKHIILENGSAEAIARLAGRLKEALS